MGKRLGNQRKPKRNKMVVTTSTESCVSAKSGAENQTKVSAVLKPVPPKNSRAAKRWNLAWWAAPMAQAAPTNQTSANSQLGSKRGRLPQPKPCWKSVAETSTTDTNTMTKACTWKRLVKKVCWKRRAHHARLATLRLNSACPLRWPMTGIVVNLPAAMGLISRMYMTIPPVKAIKLMIKGALMPCHNAKL